VDKHVRVLGVVLAGGKSRRFGQDKAEAIVDGVALLERVIGAIAAQVDELVICGRDWRDLKRIEDHPEPNLGPLGGLNGALAYARNNGFDAVLSVPVDVLPLPDNLLEILESNNPTVFAEQHLIGYWPVCFGEKLDTYLVVPSHRAFRGWLDHVAARKVNEPLRLYNVNSPSDLQAYLDEQVTRVAKK
tara:strand:- start:5835 stop:6398 length:564 start_codon:yes stop_codon:yes gene_type:complete